MEATHAPGISGRKVVSHCLAIISIATAVIHFAVSGEHFQEYWLFGVFMLVVAWLQLSWAMLAIARPSRLLLWGGAILDTAVVVVYIVTRTIGDVIGPTPRVLEPFGFGDGLCTVLEAMVVAGCGWLIVSRQDFRVSRRHLVVVPSAAGVVTAALLSTALVAGGPDMVMAASAATPSGTGAAPGMQSADGQAPQVSLATASPAGNITMPDATMQMAPGMKMASSAPCDATPTKAQQQAAVSLVNMSWQDTREYQSLAAAKAAGYRPVTPVGMPVVHYLDPAFYRATISGGPVLNTAQPQSLVYANTPEGAVLVAAMYITTPGGPTPQPGGCLTQWHVHTNLCMTGRLGVVGVLNAAHPTCPAGSTNRVTPPMMHIWFVPIPGGPTAIDASDAQIVRAAQQVASPRNGTA